VWSAAVDHRSLAAAELEERSGRRFHQFMRRYKRTYAVGSKEYKERQAIFKAHVKNVEKANHKQGGRWKAGINGLADRYSSELSRLRGYKRKLLGQGGRSRAHAQLLTKSVHPADLASLPKEWSWHKSVNGTKEVKDQGQCGSCWAFASAAVLRSHHELFQGQDRHFSEQQIVSCTENPMDCGGSGGCDGATAELAMDYVMRSGCVTADERPYTETTSECPASMKSRQLEPHPVSGALKASPQALVAHKALGGAAFGMTGWRRLPDNQLEPVLLALVNEGPAVVSLHAGAEWNMYETGILDSCEKDTVIDHAVMLLGFGVDQGTKYWHIQNSWGNDWGEDGYLRILRSNDNEEKEFCGWDEYPEIGSGCSDGPSKVWVCGHCGILNDVVMPTFQLDHAGWWARQGGRSVEVLTSRHPTTNSHPKQSTVSSRKFMSKH